MTESHVCNMPLLLHSWSRQCKIKTNIRTHCVLPGDALTGRTARTPGLQDSILLITRQLCLTCWNLKGGLQPNRDYHGKSTADFFQLAVPVKKPSVVRRVITGRLTCIWPCQCGERQRGSDELSNNISFPTLLITSSSAWRDFPRGLVSKQMRWEHIVRLGRYLNCTARCSLWQEIIT